jgi:hypothetical protein
LRLNETVRYQIQSGQPYQFANVYGDLDTTYGYDTEGHVNVVTYPATNGGPGPSYTYQFDGMHRPIGMKDQNNSPVVSGVSYGPASEMLAISYPGVSESRSYNSMLQLTALVQNGQANTYNYPTATNNGKITSQVISGEAVQYQYDSLNRLASAAGSGWGQVFSYDGFGNLTNRTPSGTAPASPATPADPATNRVSGYSYDNNGNMLLLGQTYDVENRIVSVVEGAVRYGYDAQNKRIWQGNYTFDQTETRRWRLSRSFYTASTARRWGITRLV